MPVKSRKRKSGRRIPRKVPALSRPMSEAAFKTIAIAYRMALNGFTSGYGSEQLWVTLADALNISRALCMNGVLAEEEPSVIAAQVAVIKCRYRFEAIGKWGLSGDEVVACRGVMDVLDEQFRTSTVGFLNEVIRLINRRIANGDTMEFKGEVERCTQN